MILILLLAVLAVAAYFINSHSDQVGQLDLNSADDAKSKAPTKRKRQFPAHEMNRTRGGSLKNAAFSWTLVSSVLATVPIAGWALGLDHLLGDLIRDTFGAGPLAEIGAWIIFCALGAGLAMWTKFAWSRAGQTFTRLKLELPHLHYTTSRKLQAALSSGEFDEASDPELEAAYAVECDKATTAALSADADKWRSIGLVSSAVEAIGLFLCFMSGAVATAMQSVGGATDIGQRAGQPSDPLTILIGGLVIVAIVVGYALSARAYGSDMEELAARYGDEAISNIEVEEADTKLTLVRLFERRATPTAQRESVSTNGNRNNGH